jgi:hypothetical protein
MRQSASSIRDAIRSVADVRLEAGDVLIAMGERPKLKQLDNELSAARGRAT